MRAIRDHVRGRPDDRITLRPAHAVTRETAHPLARRDLPGGPGPAVRVPGAPDDDPDREYRAIVRRAQTALRRAASVPPPSLTDDLTELDRLVALTRHREPSLRALVLRNTLCARIAAAMSDPRLGTEPDRTDDALLDEYLAVIAEHGLSLFGVDAQVMVAHRALLRGDEETALAAVSTALSHLDEQHVEDQARTFEEHRDNVGGSYRLVARSLASLGLHENGAVLLDRARVLAEQTGDDAGAVRARYDAVRLGLTWGLRLERAGRDGGPRLQAAASAAGAMLAHGPELPPDHQPLLHAARVLGRRMRPPYRHDDGRPAASGHDAARHDAATLERLHAAGAGFPSLTDQLITELARARALERIGRLEDAADLLGVVHARRLRGEPNLVLSVTRELGRLRALLAVGCDPANQAAKDSLRAYTAELEAELWSMHQARELSLRSRLAHERLSREHHQVAAQALADPLTGLPNRRALDEFLGRVLRAPEASPLSVAMIDVDGFKQVNDIISHARGDEVLRLVAGSLRRSLRAADMVARYGGDEFVVVLPGTSAADAAAALGRAVRAVADLSGASDADLTDRAERPGPGVTLSVGVVAVDTGGDPPDDPGTVLGRADAAMYRVKHAGGDAVGVGGHDVVDGLAPGATPAGLPSGETPSGGETDGARAPRS